MNLAKEYSTSLSKTYLCKTIKNYIYAHHLVINIETCIVHFKELTNLNITVIEFRID